MRLVAVAILLGLVASACGSPDAPTDFEPEDDFGQRSGVTSHADAGTPASTKRKSTTPSNTAPVVTASTPTAPAPPPSTDGTWIGNLATTDAIAFGGGNFCNYKTHFTDVHVVVVMSAGAIKSADVSANAIEETVSSCGATPQEENAHDYPYTPSSPTTATTFQVSGAAPNQPLAQMSATVTTGHVALSWHRDDIGAPLDWTITADVPLTKQ